MNPSTIDTTVRIRVYDIAPVKLNRFLSNCGAGGVYHSSVTVYGREFTFLGHPFKFSGVFSQAEDAMNVMTNGQRTGLTDEQMGMSLFNIIIAGKTSLTFDQVYEIVLGLGHNGGFRGCDYNLVRNNCNHFSQAFVNTWEYRVSIYFQIINRLLEIEKVDSRKSIGCMSRLKCSSPVFPSWINRLARICRRLPFIESIVSEKQQRNFFIVEAL